MAATVTVIRDWKSRGMKHTIADILFDSSYPDGGESVTAADFLMSIVDYVESELYEDSTHGFLQVAYDRTNSLARVVRPYGTVTGGDAEVFAIGLSADANDATLAKNSATNRTKITGFALEEVADTTNLSTVTIRVHAIGRTYGA